MVSLSFRNNELLCDFQLTLQLSPCVTAAWLQPTELHKPMNHEVETTKHQGTQWDPDLDHTPPM